MHAANILQMGGLSPFSDPGRDAKICRSAWVGDD